MALFNCALQAQCTTLDWSEINNTDYDYTSPFLAVALFGITPLIFLPLMNTKIKIIANIITSRVQ